MKIKNVFLIAAMLSAFGGAFFLNSAPVATKAVEANLLYVVIPDEIVAAAASDGRTINVRGQNPTISATKTECHPNEYVFDFSSTSMTTYFQVIWCDNPWSSIYNINLASLGWGSTWDTVTLNPALPLGHNQNYASGNFTFSEHQTAVTYNVNLYNGATLLTSVEVEEGTSYTPPASYDLAGYTFQGWYADETLETPYTGTDSVMSDINVYGDFDVDVSAVLVSLYYDDTLLGTEQAPSDAAYTPSNPTLEAGLRFVGWFTDLNLITAYTPVIMTEATDLYAQVVDLSGYGSSTWTTIIYNYGPGAMTNNPANTRIYTWGFSVAANNSNVTPGWPGKALSYTTNRWGDGTVFYNVFIGNLAGGNVIYNVVGGKQTNDITGNRVHNAATSLIIPLIRVTDDGAARFADSPFEEYAHNDPMIYSFIPRVRALDCDSSAEAVELLGIYNSFADNQKAYVNSLRIGTVGYEGSTFIEWLEYLVSL
ncbi:MAG: InlB B-repeat-containing protein, partial [Erysipelotrichaceae bacterium]|nr:InlB B-repeat-containing protein [Erysipelotrichaceae bacterium]